MKKLDFFKVLLSAVVVGASAIWAQDVIVMRDGNEVQAIVLEVGVDAIKYKKYNYQDGPYFVVSISKVFGIKYRNGEKDVFDAKEYSVAPAPQHPLYYPVYVPQYTQPAPMQIAPQQTAQYSTLDANESGRMFVFSIRQETLMGGATRGLGGLFEWGCIGNSGFYFSGEVGGGGIYFGGGFNFGGTINKDGVVKNVLGVTIGNWYSIWNDNSSYSPYNDYYNGGYPYYNYNNYSSYNDQWDYNFNFGGPFWKLIIGNTGNFDITSKWLFGMKGRNSNYNNGYYDGYSNYYGGYDYGGSLDVNFTYSLSVGWTLTKK